jgi:hypothetical protein
MKKLMLTLAGLLLVSVMAVNAQVASDSAKTSNQPSMTQDDVTNYTKDMEVIQSSDVPASLRSSLQGTEFTGWEEGKVYRNSTTNEYLIIIGDEDAKVYRFDANGQRIEDMDKDSDNSGSTTAPTTPSQTPSPTTPESTTPAPAPSPSGTTPEK